MKKNLLLILSILALSACVTQYSNQPITSISDVPHTSPESITTQDNPKESEILFLTTFSGGGTRAAALAYGVLEKLKATNIQAQEGEYNLLNELDLISSVSGGSFVSAYYGLYHDQIFDNFKDDFLKRNVSSDLFFRLINPVNWVRLASASYNRSHLTADYYDDILFDKQPLGMMNRANKPAILINATDADKGFEFIFNQRQFDWICSEAASFPISQAVVASSAVPGVFSGITLTNFAGQCGYEVPQWAKESIFERNTHSNEYFQAKRIQSYQDANERPYVHLLDGVLSDNLGIRSILDQVTVNGGIRETFKSNGLEKVKKFVVLIVNAETSIGADTKAADGLSIFSQFSSARSIPILRSNHETIIALDHNLTLWKEQIIEDRCTQGLVACEDFETYIIEVDFNGVHDANERAYLNSLPTSLALEAEAVDRLIIAADNILTHSKEYNRLLGDLNTAQ